MPTRHRPARDRRLGPVLLALTATAFAAALVTAGPGAAPARAASGDEPVWSAAIGGIDVSHSSGDEPVPLDPERDVQLALDVNNLGTEPVDIRAVRLEGTVMGLTFFSFTTQIDFTVGPGRSVHRGVDLDLADLRGQAVGLLPTEVVLLDGGHQVIGAKPAVADVHGSLASAYGLFGLAVGAVTLLLLIGLGLDIVRLALPLNRWRRGVRFLPAGVGVALTLTFTLSATRWLAPSPSLWVPLVLGCAAGAFVVGYLTPVPQAGALVGAHRERSR